ncbi:MAG: hypothetical protein JOZ99_08720 [Actinobacteria bacterium]|nr:hypothetical protein [Actinomycetota bacterium]
MIGAAAETPTPPPDAARRDARSILGERRFRPAHVPRPFAGTLRWLGRQLEPAGRALRPVGDFFQTVEGLVLLSVLVVAAAAAVAWILGTRRGANTRASGAGRVAADDSDDPRVLDQAAEIAERGGDYARAIRLRFRAGLLRLDAVGAIRLGPSSTSGQVARRLCLPEFDEIARDHELVAYGGRDADNALMLATRDGWTRVLEEVGAR